MNDKAIEAAARAFGAFLSIRGWGDCPLSDVTDTDIHRAMKVALTAAAPHMQEWQPIETAPKDEYFLCLRTDGHIVTAFRFNPSSRTDQILSTPGQYSQHASHWMPLPAPPEPAND